MTTRRTLFRATLAAVALPLESLLAKDQGVIIDVHSPDWNWERDRCRILLDGREVREVWYADTGEGLLKTYSALEDPYRPYVPGSSSAVGTWSLTAEQRARGLAEGWDMPLDGAVSRTLYGRVTILPHIR